MRRFGDPRLTSKAYIRRPGAYAIISEGSDLLLTLQDATDLELQLPGGGIDAGETPIRALHREVFEETGYRISNVRRLGAYQRFTYMAEYDLWAHKICHIFLCRPARRICEPPEPDHSVVWMPARTALTHLTNSGDRHILELLLKSRVMVR
jgi:8-oxo-dGTP diphosphatase